MNKVSVFAVLAFAAVCAAREAFESETQTILVPENSEETAELAGTTRLFADFCINSRDFVIGDIKRSTNGAAAKVYALVFDSAEAVGLQALDALHSARVRFLKQIAEPNAPIEAATNAIERMIVEAQMRIQADQDIPKNLYNAFVTSVLATGTAVGQKIADGFEQVMKRQGLFNIVAMLENTCDHIGGYEKQLHERFNETKAELVVQESRLAAVSFESLPCITSRRVVRMDSICKLARSTPKQLANLLATMKKAP